jgi:hypothetical protein
MRQGRGGVYLLTWTTYGTWLPGDVRGFVGDAPVAEGRWTKHNAVGTPYDWGYSELERRARERTLGGEVTLGASEAGVAAGAFGEVGLAHGLDVQIGAVLRTHVHLVVSSPQRDGADVLKLFKGVSARRLTQAIGAPPGPRWWTTGGSHRLLVDEASQGAAWGYVRDQTGVLAWCGRATGSRCP